MVVWLADGTVRRGQFPPFDALLAGLAGTPVDHFLGAATVLDGLTTRSIASACVWS